MRFGCRCQQCHRDRDSNLDQAEGRSDRASDLAQYSDSDALAARCWLSDCLSVRFYARAAYLRLGGPGSHWQAPSQAGLIICEHTHPPNK
jgi:hypothetical protein